MADRRSYFPSQDEGAKLFKEMPIEDKIDFISESVELRGSNTKLTYLVAGMHLGAAQEAIRNGQRSRANNKLKEAMNVIVEGDESMANLIGF